MYTEARTLDPPNPNPNFDTWYVLTPPYAHTLRLTPDTLQILQTLQTLHLTSYRPPNPVEFLATYLLQNNPQKE